MQRNHASRPWQIPGRTPIADVDSPKQDPNGHHRADQTRQPVRPPVMQPITRPVRHSPPLGLTCNTRVPPATTSVW